MSGRRGTRRSPRHRRSSHPGAAAGLLAQGVPPQDAAALGVYLHGLAGEHAAEDLTSYGVCATDIIYRFPEAFKFIDI